MLTAVADIDNTRLNSVRVIHRHDCCSVDLFTPRATTGKYGSNTASSILMPAGLQVSQDSLRCTETLEPGAMPCLC